MPLLLLLALLASVEGENGALRVHSQPGTEVVWEGVSLGSTDARGLLTISDIPPGTFTLSLKKPGFGDYQTAVTISADETTSLEAELRPASARPASGRPVTKPSQSKVSPAGKRAESARSDQENRLNELLKAKPKTGPLPVWPAASRPAPERTADGMPIWPFVVGGLLLIAVFWLSRRLKPTDFSRPPALLADTDVPQRAHTPEKMAAFLNDLKKREELLEQGVEIVPDRVKTPIIDLDSGSVREVKEQ